LETPKKRNKSGIDHCPRQNEHIDIKTVAYNHVTVILQRCQKGQKMCLSSSPFSSSHFLFPRNFSGTIEDTYIINTRLEPLRPADAPFGGFVDIKPQFWGVRIGVFKPNGQNIESFVLSKLLHRF